MANSQYLTWCRPALPLACIMLGLFAVSACRGPGTRKSPSISEVTSVVDAEGGVFAYDSYRLHLLANLEGRSMWRIAPTPPGFSMSPAQLEFFCSRVLHPCMCIEELRFDALAFHIPDPKMDAGNGDVMPTPAMLSVHGKTGHVRLPGEGTWRSVGYLAVRSRDASSRVKLGMTEAQLKAQLGIGYRAFETTPDGTTTGFRIDWRNGRVGVVMPPSKSHKFPASETHLEPDPGDGNFHRSEHYGCVDGELVVDLTNGVVVGIRLEPYRWR